MKCFSIVFLFLITFVSNNIGAEPDELTFSAKGDDVCRKALICMFLDDIEFQISKIGFANALQEKKENIKRVYNVRKENSSVLLPMPDYIMFSITDIYGVDHHDVACRIIAYYEHELREFVPLSLSVSRCEGPSMTFRYRSVLRAEDVGLKIITQPDGSQKTAL